jgi:ribosomal protein L31E
MEGRAEGDPRKIADVIVRLANSDDVPMRLILGVDAEQRAQRAEAARAIKAEKWRHLTVSTVLKMDVSTADCLWQRVESIPELQEGSTNMKYSVLTGARILASNAAAIVA